MKPTALSVEERKPRWLKLSLTTKLLVALLGLTVVSLSIVGLLTFRYLKGLGDYALESNLSLGRSAVQDSAGSLEKSGEEAIKQKAIDVARQVEIYLKGCSPASAADLKYDKELRRIAVQPVGKTGYTAIVDANRFVILLHKHPGQEGRGLTSLATTLPSFWAVIRSSAGGKDASGYYDWKELDGSVKRKYAHIAPIKSSLREGALTLWATTYIDEFTQPATETSHKIEAAVIRTGQHINDKIRTTRYVFAGIFTALLLAVTVLGFWLARTITRPILALNASSKRIGAGDLDHKVEVRTGDEIEDLSDSFNKMASDLKVHIQNLKETTAAKERIESELRIATEIQTSMLPRLFPAFPNRKEFDLFATMEPAREVGGDFYDFFFITPDKLCFLIGDVCGKGVPAALFMAISKTLLKMEAMAGHSADEILTRVNNTLCPDNDSCMFFTCLCAIIDTKTGEVQLADGGHNPPLLSNGKGFEFLGLAKGIPVGPMPGFKFQCTRLTLPPQSVLFFYTDGVTEATNANEDPFSEERLQQSLHKLIGKNMAGLVRGVREEIETFVRGADQSDDITMLAFRFHGKESSSE